MRIAFLCSLLLAFSNFCHGQSFEIEKLRKLIKEHPQQDTARVNRLNEISNLSPIIPIAEMENYATEALVLARKLNYTKGEGYALLVNARVANVKGNKEAIVKLLQQADSIAKQIGDQSLKWWVLYRSTSSVSDLRLQLPGLLKAEALALEYNNTKFIIPSQYTISSRYFSLGDYALAMEYGIKSLKNAEALRAPYLLYPVYENIVSIYSLIGEYDKANVYLQKLPGFIRELGLGDESLANLYNALGENTRLAKKFPEAIGYYKQSIATTSDAYSIAIANSNLADVYVSMDSLFLAFQYADLAKAGFKNAGKTDADSWVESILAHAYLKKNMPDSALYYARTGYNSASETGIMEDLLSTSKTLADAYALKNDFKNAYIYFNRYISSRDSVMGAEVKNRTTVLEHNYEMKKKEDEIALLTGEQKLQKNFLVSALIVLGLILIAAFLLLRNIRQKQKANLLLKEQKLEIDEKASELSIQKDHLEKSYNNVELLGEIGRQITSSLSVEKIIGTVYDNVNALMDANVFGIGIYHELLQRIEFPATYESGQALPFYTNDINDANRLAPLCFISGKEIIIGDLSKEYSNFLQTLPTPHVGEQPLSLIYLPLSAKEKKLGVITIQSFKHHAYTDYHLFMLRNIAVYTAIALDNAESYEELTQTIKSLKTAQGQLIQSEKMASLGELTAGIAHEIQNPLNFVNNFSEVNTELIGELKAELAIGNMQLAIEIANDIESNEEKINHHGKRADAIVKGMLQHSRSSNGQKELTDINALCDEYLRLSYHGLRAKDKSFNATMNTDFDASIEKVNIVSQDIGRVILNLLNNAFYAIGERSEAGSPDLNIGAASLPSPEKIGINTGGFSDSANKKTPTVWMSTSRNPSLATGGSGAGVLISISDNGPGIPQNIIDKIFQPFFTTKPTGEGTGLGLSLSYDIVKAHGGTLKVDTVHGEGTTFTIALPRSL